MNRHLALPRLLGAGMITMAALLAGSTLAQMKTAAIEVSPIGVVDEVRNDAFGTLPNRAPERLRNTAAVFFDERIETSVNALSRLLFVDDTTLTVGANSSMILDRFVYDPKTAKGEILVHMATGVFRFVSGKMPKENVTLVTPGASIGIRGTDFIVEILGDGTTRVSVLHGRVIMTPTAGGNTFSLEPGQMGSIAKGMKTGQVETCPASNCAPSLETAATTRDLIVFGKAQTASTSPGIQLKDIEPATPNPETTATRSEIDIGKDMQRGDRSRPRVSQPQRPKSEGGQPPGDGIPN